MYLSSQFEMHPRQAPAAVRLKRPGVYLSGWPTLTSKGLGAALVKPNPAPTTSSSSTSATAASTAQSSALANWNVAAPPANVASAVQSACTGQPCNSTFVQQLEASLQSGLLIPLSSASGANCSGVPPSNSDAKITGVAGSLAQSGVSIAGALGAGATIGTSTLPIIGTAIGLITGLLSGIFAHHSQAVAEQNDLLCQNVPAANSALQLIDSQVAAGTLTASEATSTYQQLLSEFQSAMQSDPSYKSGDALWGYWFNLQLLVNTRIANLAQMPSASPVTSAVQGVVSEISSVTGISAALVPWLLLGGVGLAVYLAL